MRKLMRSVARHNMQRMGMAHINRKGGDGNSFFAKHWRDYI